MRRNDQPSAAALVVAPGLLAPGRRRVLALGLVLAAPLLLQACGSSRGTRQAARSVPGESGAGWSCVPYARERSGIALTGDAWQWWSAAEGRYPRGRAPREGAVLVLMRTARLRQGHVAVVARLVSRREIRVDHANWGSGGGKGRVARDQPVQDISPENDWSLVRVWYPRGNDFGQTNWPAFGFIYPA
ncbi:MAG: CHAP domain-containing protein [Acetobacteraceae bacterium]|nr:CHAP domain-containing protein [Acetobacteraceae bacterium]